MVSPEKVPNKSRLAVGIGKREVDGTISREGSIGSTRIWLPNGNPDKQALLVEGDWAEHYSPFTLFRAFESSSLVFEFAP